MLPACPQSYLECSLQQTSVGVCGGSRYKTRNISKEIGKECKASLMLLKSKGPLKFIPDIFETHPGQF